MNKQIVVVAKDADFFEFKRDAEWLVAGYAKIEDADDAEPRLKTIAKKVLKNFDVFDPYDECENIKADQFHVSRSAARKMLTTLLGSIPNYKMPHPEIFTKEMFAHVFAEQCTPLVLRAAVEQLIAERTFGPSIAEVLAEIRKQKDFWDKVLEAADGLTAEDRSARFKRFFERVGNAMPKSARGVAEVFSDAELQTFWCETADEGDDVEPCPFKTVELVRRDDGKVVLGGSA